MKKTSVAIIGAGIVGATSAYYLAKSGYKVTIFDKEIGQATSAAAGIISPWLSQRRNQIWYRLASDGAAFYPSLMQDLKEDGITDLPYQQVGALVFKKTPQQAEKLLSIAKKRRQESPMIGDLDLLSPQGIQEKIPSWIGQEPAVFASGGGRVDGALLRKYLLEIAIRNGATFYQEQVTLHREEGTISVVTKQGQNTFDHVILSCGAWLNDLLNPIDLKADVRPQKGQLIELQLPNNLDTSSWPVFMLDGEIDILPFANGRIVIGATHENDGGFDLTPDHSLQEKMLHQASQQLSILKHLPIQQCRIGTRAYTSDFQPFFGTLSQFPQISLASGLGSSGLTSGALIGKLLSDTIRGISTDFPSDHYSPENYIATMC